MAPFRGQRPKASLMLALSLLLWPGLQRSPLAGQHGATRCSFPAVGKANFLRPSHMVRREPQCTAGPFLLDDRAGRWNPPSAAVHNQRTHQYQGSKDSWIPDSQESHVQKCSHLCW